MAEFLEYREMEMADLLIDNGQSRTRNVDKEVDTLAESIRRQGLLQPIVVCKAQQEGKWEILSGQRRYLAHKLLKRGTINTVVLDGRVDEAEAKAISITENLVRRNLSGPELIDGVTFLYNKYGNAKAVHEATGIPYNDVRRYVKYPRLSPGLKKLVGKGEVDLKVALRAQDLMERRESKVGEPELARLAKGMDAMSRAQQTKFVKAMATNPDASVEDLFASAEVPAEEVSQIIVTLPKTAHEVLKARAKERGTTQDEAAAAILLERLVA